MTDQQDVPILTVYGRPECHLCDELIAALKPWQSRYNFLVEEVNIDTDAALTSRYAARIPVLAVDDVEVSQYFLDEKQLRQALENRNSRK
ncbi:MAG: glutaredoxin family protein [Gammaproteobacteria bacterium]